MSVSMVSASAVGQTYQRPQGPGKEIREGIDTLKKAVESGDMTAVQSAYDSLSKLQSDKQGSSGSTSSTSSSASNSNDPLSKLLSSVGEALKSGDVSQVQQAFAKNGPPSGGPGGAGGPGGPGGAGGPPPNGPPPGEAGGSDEVRSAVGSLAESLQSGDLSGAQESLSALTDLLKSSGEDDSEDDSGSSTSGSGTASSSNSFLDKLTGSLDDLGSALGSGDLAGAQKLFASLATRGSQGVDITA